MRVLALDFGLRRTGVAVSDESGLLASPVGTVPGGADGRAMREIGRFVREYRPAEMVVGDPRRLEGGGGALSGRVAEFAGELSRAFGVPVVLRDERYTSFEAEEKLKEQGMKWRRRRARRDKAAAAVLLQAYLDERRRAGA